MVRPVTKWDAYMVVKKRSYHRGSLAGSHGLPHHAFCKVSVGRWPPNIHRSTLIGITTDTSRLRLSAMPRL